MGTWLEKRKMHKLEKQYNQYHEFEELEKALECALKLLEIETSVYQPDHPDISTSLWNILPCKV